MYKFSFKTIQKKLLADISTPVELYLKLRDKFSNLLLLESSDYQTTKNHSSIICINLISEIRIHNNKIKILYPDNKKSNLSIDSSSPTSIQFYLYNFMNKFYSTNNCSPYSGFYGYTSYDSVQFFENIKFNSFINKSYDVPQIRFGFYANLIIFKHFYNELYIVEHKFYEKNETSINLIIDLVYNKNYSYFPFHPLGKKYSNITDDEYKKMVSSGIKACIKGDVFQIVISRQFKQKFKGDEFNVYRALRSINPSPYLFYFDYGDYKLLGSSPESQIIVKNNKAYINPIAGTIKRSGNDEKDKKLAKKLIKDPKENAEHVMLVDLARNDLSKNSINVIVDNYKEVQYFSHVLHMVSKVSCIFKKKISLIKVFGDTFPAGTLSGTPKYKAMKLIDNIEKINRGIYGGAIGFFGLDGNLNTAIIIRSFISKNNILFFQAGAGIVYGSKADKELEEVNNKLMALNNAIELAKNLFK
ncbi:Anthranilate synthase, aminase component [Candidatus Karelsulcia muelleri str. Sulcia-ALF]|uniref:anthranilate synthase component I family protein n=1 Tax=Candidatus Karelsulcia muelleri TaxID=336810 RepID=UPI000383D767|nr:anthranilate synthase component I family protein [Candidatus Karelsulcia muelleri]AGS33379.1 Anthranilate synthase, aminase component [Candidatus Karelsulcia muelleri str. Sulcia-ALF]QND78365.1 Anthranilate synthase, aminase component [Candidatus Karelsulcia muelleri]